MTDTAKLLHELRTFMGGELGNRAADEIERLQRGELTAESVAAWLDLKGLTAVSKADAEKVERCKAGGQSC